MKALEAFVESISLHFMPLSIRFRTLGNTQTIFAAYLPDVTEHKKLPVVYWLSGLTCTDENFSQKAGAFQAACDHQVVLVMPDTSPRGDGVPDEEPHTYDFGVGAGFYLNATTEKYKQHYNMRPGARNEGPEGIEIQRCIIYEQAGHTWYTPKKGLSVRPLLHARIEGAHSIMWMV